MAVEDLLHPYGTTLEHSDDGGANYDLIDACILISPPSHKRDVASATVMTSTGFHKEKAPSWKDTDDLDCEIFYTAAGREQLTDIWDADSTDYWRITFPLLDGENTPFKIVGQFFIGEIDFSQAKAEENNLYSCPFKLVLATLDGYVETQPT